METNIPISLTNQNEDIREYEKNYEEAIAQVKADTEKRLQEMKEEHDKCLKELIEKRDNTVVQQKKDAEIIDIKNANRLLRSVFASMLIKAEKAQDPAKPVKFIAEQFMRFANDIYLPIVLPGYKIDCEFLKTQRTTIDGKKLPDDKNAGIKVILLDQEAYDDRIAKISELPGCCGKCLASKHDLTKISDEAFDPNNTVIRADAEFTDAVEDLKELGDAVGEALQDCLKRSVGLSASRINFDNLRKKYNRIVETILKVYPSCQLLTIPENATVGQVVAAVMEGAKLIRDLISLIKSKKTKKASKKSSKKTK